MFFRGNRNSTEKLKKIEKKKNFKKTNLKRRIQRKQVELFARAKNTGRSCETWPYTRCSCMHLIISFTASNLDQN